MASRREPRSLGKQAFVAQVEQIADQVVSLGWQAEVGQIQAGLGPPAADVELDDNALAHQSEPLGIAGLDAVHVQNACKFVLLAVERGGVDVMVLLLRFTW